VRRGHGREQSRILDNAREPKEFRYAIIRAGVFCRKALMWRVAVVIPALRHEWKRDVAMSDDEPTQHAFKVANLSCLGSSSNVNR
jgi:hypothetical protein